MDPNFLKANSGNLPKIDAFMVANFLSKNADYCASELRNVKTSRASREDYGDEAISHVQLRRERSTCTVKCRMCPEHRVRSKPYTVIIQINEATDTVLEVQCQDCAGAKGGCKHAIAFLMWIHRRSEEPPCTSVECYWNKASLANTSHVLLKEIVTPSPPAVGNSALFDQFMVEGAARDLRDCQLLKSSLSFIPAEEESSSLHQLAVKFPNISCPQFLEVAAPFFTEELIAKVQQTTLSQSDNPLWHELRYGRITASNAFSVSRCLTADGTLVATLLGARIPDTPAMKRGRELEKLVRKVASKALKAPIQKCGLYLCSTHIMLAASPDGMLKDAVVEIKCPFKEKNIKNYILNNKIREKFNAQMQLQMFITGMKKGFFVVADPNFETNKKINILTISYDDNYIQQLVPKLVKFWEQHIYPVLQGVNTDC